MLEKTDKRKIKDKIIDVVIDRKHKRSKHFLKWPAKKLLHHSPSSLIKTISKQKGNQLDSLNIDLLFRTESRLTRVLKWPFDFFDEMIHRRKKIPLRFHIFIFFVLIIIPLVIFEALILYSAVLEEKEYIAIEIQQSLALWQKGYKNARTNDFVSASNNFYSAYKTFNGVDQYIKTRHPILKPFF